MNDPSKQYNPKIVNSTIATPEWSIKPRQIYEAHTENKIHRKTRIWVKEAAKMRKQKDTRRGTQNKTYNSTNTRHGRSNAHMELGRAEWRYSVTTGEWILSNLQHTQTGRYRAKEPGLILKAAIKINGTS